MSKRFFSQAIPGGWHSGVRFFGNRQAGVERYYDSKGRIHEWNVYYSGPVSFLKLEWRR